MKLRFNIFVLTVFILALSLPSFAQAVDTFIGQVTNSASQSFAGSISGDGRFVVFESRGNLDTQNPRNSDGNIEIFLWDYAQRRIFQITDTKSVLIDPTAGTAFTNVRVEITNVHPVISNDGKWIAFSSNATDSVAGQPVTPNNPGRFDGNAFTTPAPSPSTSPGTNPLTQDANLELWLYRIPDYPGVADLSVGDEQPLTFLSPFDANGTAVARAVFFQVTNTPASQLPRSSTASSGATVADDNHDPSISDNGGSIAFVSSRDLVAGGNSATTQTPEDNDEIFTFTWSGSPTAGVINQITKTPRGSVSSPIYSRNPNISGSGTRVSYASNGENQTRQDVVGQTRTFSSCVSNPPTTRNEEIFYADMGAGGPTSCNQITNTTPTSAGAPVNVFDPGRRMSRDGNFIAFDSYADLEHGGANSTSFALYVCDIHALPAACRQIGPRSDADSSALGGDVDHYPGFTDYDGTGAPTTLIFATRENINPTGTLGGDGGMNTDASRPAQIYSYPIGTSGTPTFKGLTKFPAPTAFLASTQAIPSNTSKRIAFSLSLTEIGTGNEPDLLSEVYYMVNPTVTSQSTVTPTFATGASGLTVLPSPTPTVSPTPTPSPTPVTPSAVVGLSPGMLAVLKFPADSPQPITARTAVGSNRRSFQLPIELSGVALSINGTAAGLKSVSPQAITFVVPPCILNTAPGSNASAPCFSTTAAGTSLPLVVNINGTVVKTNMTIVPARPDLFTTSPTGIDGRARIFDVVNRVPTPEPLTAFTVQLRGGKRVQTRARLYLTGVANVPASAISIRIGSVTISGAQVVSGGLQAEPGVQTIDFLIPSELRGAADKPIVVTVNVGGTNFTSRLDDTAPLVTILP